MLCYVGDKLTHLKIHTDHSLFSLSLFVPLQVHDIFYPFVQTTEEEFTFIWVNESKTGFSHLYKITSLLQAGCHRWAEGYHHTEGEEPGDAPAHIFFSSSIWLLDL